MMAIKHPWVEDIAEQLALAKSLHTSQRASVQRLVLIVTDNAVEVMLKTYVENAKGLPFFGLSRGKWDDVRNSFPRMLAMVLSATKAPLDEKLIGGFHDLRNQLYHESHSLAPDQKDTGQYIQVARELLSYFFGVTFSDDEWAAIARGLFTEPAEAGERYYVISGLAALSEPIAVLAAVREITAQKNSEPKLREIRDTMSAGGCPPANLSATIRRLRARKLLKAGHLALTPSGLRVLEESYKP